MNEDAKMYYLHVLSYPLVGILIAKPIPFHLFVAWVWYLYLLIQSPHTAIIKNESAKKCSPTTLIKTQKRKRTPHCMCLPSLSTYTFTSSSAPMLWTKSNHNKLYTITTQWQTCTNHLTKTTTKTTWCQIHFSTWTWARAEVNMEGRIALEKYE